MSVQAFYGGTAVGHGIADILFGRVNPSAKLPMSFPLVYSAFSVASLRDTMTSINKRVALLANCCAIIPAVATLASSPR